METLYSWSLRRAGAKMTLTHSCGKITGVDTVAPNANGVVVARKGDQEWRLASPPFTNRGGSHVNTGVSDLFFNYEDACEAMRADNAAVRAQRLGAAADSFRVMLECAGLPAPTSDALVADFLGRV